MILRYYDYLIAARINHAEGRFVASWHNLLEAEFAKDEEQNRWTNRKPNTPRQKEIQRLWQQRGLLERTKANLSSTFKEAKHLKIFNTCDVLNHAIMHLTMMIEDNINETKTVKERIPNDS